MFSIVKSIIDNWDPYSLLASHAPQNEFDTESAMVTALINENSSIDEIAIAISKVFSQRFFPEDFPLEKCLNVAEKLKNSIEQFHRE